LKAIPHIVEFHGGLNQGDDVDDTTGFIVCPYHGSLVYVVTKFFATDPFSLGKLNGQ
jgi:hypothetical protein